MNSINQICSILQNKNLDAIIITSKENTSYITGINDFEGTIFACDPEKVICFTDSRYIEIAEIKSIERGFKASTATGNNYPKEIAKLCKEYGINKVGFEDKCVSVYEYESLKKYIECDFVGVSDDLLKIRSVKTDWEVSNIQEAQNIAEKAFDIVLGELKPGMTEIECKARLEYLMSLYGSEKTSFPTILISGSKTSMPHGTPDSKVIQRGEFVTFDFGAVVNGYCSDMTRTVAVGYVNDEMKKVYDTVLLAQEEAVKAAKEGMTGAELDSVARGIIDKAGYGKYFGHSLGHGVGIEVHEEPRVSPKNNKRLETGNVITIEPGIYIPGVFGVRIEDMLYIKGNGNVNLTNYSKKLIIL